MKLIPIETETVLAWHSWVYETKKVTALFFLRYLAYIHSPQNQSATNSPSLSLTYNGYNGYKTAH
jgi:hypothetical protein